MANARKLLFVVVLMASTLPARADVELHEVIRSYRVVLSADNLYKNDTYFGLIGERGDSAEFRISSLMLANNLCATCLCEDLPYPKGRDPEIRIEGFTNDLGDSSVWYYLEVILAKDYDHVPYFGIDMIERINQKDTIQITNLLEKFKVVNWVDLERRSELYMDSLINRPILDSLLEKHKKAEKEITPLRFSTSNTRMNIMYRGVWTSLDVAIPEVPAENTFIRVSEAKVKGKWGKFEVWILSDRSKECKVEVYSTQEDDTLYVGTHVYRIKNIPPPKANFLGKTNKATVSIPKLRSGRFLSAKLEDFLYDVRFRVKSFDCVITRDGHQTTWSNKGAGLNNTIRDHIALMTAGDVVEFRNIIAINDIEQEYLLDPIIITAK